VPDGLPRPNALPGGRDFAGALKTTANLSEGASFLPDPFEDVPDDGRLLWNGFKSGFAPAVVNSDVAIPERCVRHHVQRSALGGVLFPAPAPLHDLCSLVL
jgi:hypothetical protein